MKLKRETDRRIAVLERYNGICDGCGTPVEYDEPFYTIEVTNEDDRYVVCPIDIFSCPSCYKSISLMKIYKDMNVQEEFAEIRNEHKEDKRDFNNSI